MLGRAFCLAAMIKCGKGTETEHLLILVELFKILKSKDYLRQECIQVISLRITADYLTLHLSRKCWEL